MRSRHTDLDTGVFEPVDPNDLNVTPDDFRGISFDDWVDIFCRYAVSLAKRGQARECWPILHSMQEANIFFEGRRLQHLHVCWLSKQSYPHLVLP